MMIQPLLMNYSCLKYRNEYRNNRTINGEITKNPVDIYKCSTKKLIVSGGVPVAEGRTAVALP